jgi:stage III sporulation protein AF
VDYLSSWISNIILFIFLAVIVDMLLPNSTLQKYAKMVIGLLLITIILTPIMKLFSEDVDAWLKQLPIVTENEEKKLENLIEMKKKEIQASHSAYILKQMAVQLEMDVKEELMDKYGYEIKEIQPEMEMSNEPFPTNTEISLKSVTVYLTKNNNESIQAVKPITINTNQPASNQVEDLENVIAFLANSWGLEESQLQIHVEGGNG